MNWRRFVWIISLLLIAIIAWELADLRGIYRKIASVRSESSDDPGQILLSLQQQVASQRKYLESLEKIAIWQPGLDLMTWLTQQADALNVKIIGLEQKPVEKLLEYQRVPFSITVRGDYNPLGRFINKLEHSPNAVRIDSLRIRRKESTPEYITTDISLSYFQVSGL